MTNDEHPGPEYDRDLFTFGRCASCGKGGIIDRDWNFCQTCAIEYMHHLEHHVPDWEGTMTFTRAELAEVLSKALDEMHAKTTLPEWELPDDDAKGNSDDELPF